MTKRKLTGREKWTLFCINLYLTAAIVPLFVTSILGLDLFWKLRESCLHHIWRGDRILRAAGYNDEETE